MNKKAKHIKKRWPWQTKRENGLQSQLMDKSSEQTLRQASQLRNTYHQSCQTLPYSKFIDAMVSGNPIFLVIKGHPSAEELERAWDEIKSEYADTIKTIKSKSIFECFHKMS